MRMPTRQIYLGRQPILDRQHNVVAYELLFRREGDTEAHVSDDALATGRVISHTFKDLGMRAVLGGCKGFINVDAQSLMNRMIETLPRDRVVIELLEVIDPTRRVVQRCRDLKSMGYRLALDDFIKYGEAYHPLLELVDIVKIDTLNLAPQTLSELVERVKIWPPRLLAEKVETRARARQCLALGFEFFQGFFFARPTVLTGRAA